MLPLCVERLIGMWLMCSVSLFYPSVTQSLPNVVDETAILPVIEPFSSLPYGVNRHPCCPRQFVHRLDNRSGK
jgi:hypothetical protein